LTVVMVAGLFVCSLASAQSGYQADQLHLGPDQSNNYFSVHSPGLLYQDNWTLSLAYSFVFEPVRIDDPSSLTPLYAPPYNGQIVDAQSALNILGAIGITSWFQVGLDLPIVLHQSGESFTGLADINAVDSAAGIGDIRLVPKLQLFETKATEEQHQFSAALIVDFGLPTGDRDKYQGGGLRLTPILAVQWRSAVGFRLAGNVGFGWRSKHVVIADQTVENTFNWSVAAEVPILKKHLALVAEVFSDLGPELLLGFKGSAYGFSFTAAAGPGMQRDDTLTPNWRMLFAVSYNGGSQPPLDFDGDGLADKLDSCPHKPEDKDGFEDEDGCPDYDNDKDGVPDRADECPLLAEDKDLFDDQDGCPDPDNDQDGIVDKMDRCPGEQEDKDGFQDGDGCPEADNDNDRIADVDDKCPNDPEDPDGDQDQDGCPEFAPVVRINLVVFFDPNLFEIRNTDQIQLNKAAQTLIAMPNHAHVWIEGHADDRGEPKMNHSLALARAGAVYKYLRERGVPAERMTVQSYGETKELLIGKNDSDRQGNRRVEFRVGPRSLSKEEQQ
jgi:outer membrane protein OmpA-like peptidoglycan-associated protein